LYKNKNLGLIKIRTRKIYKKLSFFIIIALFGVGCINVGNCYEDTTYLTVGNYTYYFVDMVAGDNLTWSFDTYYEPFIVNFQIGGSVVSEGLETNSGIYTASSTDHFSLVFTNLDTSLFRDGFIHIYFEVNVPPPPLPGPFTLTSTATNPDTDGSFSLEWTASADSDDYSVYQDNVLLSSDVTSLFYSITVTVNNTYDFKVIAYNVNGETESNEISVIVAIPPGEPSPTPSLIPSFNPLIIIGIIGCLSGISAIIINKRIRK